MSGMTDELALEAVAKYLGDNVYQHLADRLREDEAAPAPVAGDAVESIAIALWHRFAPDDRIEWEDEAEKAIYRDAAQQVAALAQDRASQAGAPVGVDVADEMERGRIAFDEAREAGSHERDALDAALAAALRSQP